MREVFYFVFIFLTDPVTNPNDSAALPRSDYNSAKQKQSIAYNTYSYNLKEEGSQARVFNSAV